MARLFEVRLPLVRAYTRDAMFAIELLDSVTLERVSSGVDVIAKGLLRQPVVNAGGLFVWLTEDLKNLEKISIEPRTVPFEPVEIAAAQVARQLNRVELRPLASYPFAAGTTALRGSVYERRVKLGETPVPIGNATVQLEWLDDDGTTWHAWGSLATTNSAGAFTAVLRLARGQLAQVDQPVRADRNPFLDGQGRMTVRLSVRRQTGSRKQAVFPLPLGRVADEVYAWDELQ
ncbi:hypothetical protein SAMN04487926_13820 [Paraburkholderia steynii]|uniref:Uncharacterized protein n=1 Tax=Paraburkholderia steynii TaxID=1245441 RepID=A0A7Z7FM65_9BURK|nr:hypothetical protein [Paraburkholderia steynii]SDJ22398.1 hypothetical protein SAMN04487926_13820 [Paraburkholderia steynii]